MLVKRLATLDTRRLRRNSQTVFNRRKREIYDEIKKRALKIENTIFVTQY